MRVKTKYTEEREQWAPVNDRIRAPLLDASTVLVTRLPLNSGIHCPSEHIWGIFSASLSPPVLAPLSRTCPHITKLKTQLNNKGNHESTQ